MPRVTWCKVGDPHRRLASAAHGRRPDPRSPALVIPAGDAVASRAASHGEGASDAGLIHLLTLEGWVPGPRLFWEKSMGNWRRGRT